MDLDDVDPDPLVQIGRWLGEARQAAAAMVEAMCVATATPDGLPSARMVLLRGLDTGLVFFTDYESAKGSDLQANPRAAAVLHWLTPVHRQVRAQGPVTRVSAEESDRYWASRPLGSRRSAVSSRQSRVIPDRADLERRVAALADLPAADPALARPARWGGFRITPERVELWEEGPSRLHDRLRYRRDGGRWVIERLSP